jgi:hypothetical protein
MLEAITRRFRLDKRGVSNVIVVMLSLVLIVIIVGNVIMWSYQMNQLDLERMQEKLVISNVTRVTRSPWYTPLTEYSIVAGTRMAGTYVDTKTLDSVCETFREELALVLHPSGYSVGGSTTYVSGAIPDLSSDDSMYMTFRSYPNYEIDYQESPAQTQTTSTTYQDKTTISFTPQVTADFLIIATAEVQGSSTGYQTRAQLTVNSTTYQELRYRVKDTTDWYPFSGLKRMPMAAGDTYEIKIQFCTSNVAGVASIRNARLLVFSLQSEYVESESLSTTGDTNWQDKTALMLDVPVDGEYLLLATANYRGSSTFRDTRVRLVQDSNVVHSDNVGRPGADTTASYYTFGVMRKVALTSGIHNFTIQFCSSDAPGIAGINYAHLTAIRIDQFEANHYSESEGESIPASANTWYDKVENTYTANDANYLILGSMSFRSGSTWNSVAVDFQTDSTSKQSPLIEERDASSYESAFFITCQVLASGSKTDKLRYLGESTNTRVRNARLISCELPNKTQIVDVELGGTGCTVDLSQVEWTIDCYFTTNDVATVFQLYNYQKGGYPISGDGFMSETVNSTDVTVSQVISVNCTDFRDGSGNFKTRIMGVKATSVQFELRIDLLEIEANASSVYQLRVGNDFLVDLSSYPLSLLKGLEVFVRYNSSEDGERWFLKAYNWTAMVFSDFGFNNTSGSQPSVGEWNEYAINVTSEWASYVNSGGVLRLEFSDEALTMNQTIVGIDFLAVRVIVDGSQFEFQNSSPFTSHIVAIWIVDSTFHERLTINLFVNSGEQVTLVRTDATLPEDDFVVKIVTERGNVSVFPRE